jgi:hypothetical protein
VAFFVKLKRRTASLCLKLLYGHPILWEWEWWIPSPVFLQEGLKMCETATWRNHIL